ncbi:MAG: cysteine hydrolase family protein [Gemmatimonadales bacterium]
MSGLIFWDVDTQVDFMHPSGKLYVPEAEKLIPNLARLTQHALANGIRIIASADDHVPDHPEISSEPDFKETFPAHCMRGTAGQRKIPETTLDNCLVIEPKLGDTVALRNVVRSHSGAVLFHKYTFDVFSNPNVEVVLEELGPSEVVVYGVALDVCNKYVIEGILSRYPEISVYLVIDATKPIEADKVETLLTGWRERGLRVITTDDALGMQSDSREKTMSL